MTFPSKVFGGFPNMKEPEQLDLFAHVLPTPTHVSHPVCHQISNAACHAYFQSPTNELINRVRNLLVHHCGEVRLSEASSAWRDYLYGASTALNPLPLSTTQTFLLSDRIALALDWQTVQSDVDQIWRAISIARNLAESGSNEQRGQQKREQDAERASVG
jgi:hypothetical protein